jgi:transposase
MARTRRQFSAEFKREAAQLAQRPGVSKTQVAKELGVNQGVLRRWVQQFESAAWEKTSGAVMKSPQTQEVERLRRELLLVELQPFFDIFEPLLLRHGVGLSLLPLRSLARQVCSVRFIRLRHHGL